MTISNKFGWLVLTTGNKSEMATGYATLYGDMAGGFAVIKDVPKTLVYALVPRPQRARGPRRDPASTSSRSRRRPSSRPASSTPTRCPPYDVLDPIIEGYVEDDLSVAELDRARATTPSSCGASRGMVDRNEYKRRQAPPACACRRRRSARTAACRSPTAGPAPPAMRAGRPGHRQQPSIAAARALSASPPASRQP